MAAAAAAAERGTVKLRTLLRTWVPASSAVNPKLGPEIVDACGEVRIALVGTKGFGKSTLGTAILQACQGFPDDFTGPFRIRSTANAELEGTFNLTPNPLVRDVAYLIDARGFKTVWLEEQKIDDAVDAVVAMRDGKFPLGADMDFHSFFDRVKRFFASKTEKAKNRIDYFLFNVPVPEKKSVDMSFHADRIRELQVELAQVYTGSLRPHTLAA